jgi:GNAT superfamily N-acetyltransferase
VNLKVRKAVLSDADPVLECLHIAFEPFRKFYSTQGFLDTTLDREMLLRRMTEMTVFVAETDDGRIVGTIAGVVLPDSNGEEGHIRGMAVLPDQAGTGIAQALLEAVESDLAGQGCSRISLDTTAPLQRAINFYRKHGYVESGKVGDHFGMPLYEYVKKIGVRGRF